MNLGPLAPTPSEPDRDAVILRLGLARVRYAHVGNGGFGPGELESLDRKFADAIVALRSGAQYSVYQAFGRKWGDVVVHSVDRPTETIRVPFVLSDAEIAAGRLLR